MAMRSEKFFLPIRPVSWNCIASKHWRAYKNLKDEQAEITWLVLRQKKIKPFKNPIKLLVEVYWKGRIKRDLDNVCFKSALDVLKKAEVIEDDSLEFIRSITITGHMNCAHEGLVFTLEEIL